MATVTLASLQNMRKELVNSRYYLNIRSGYMAPVTLHCSYGDSGETVTFYIFDGGDELDLNGSVVSVHGTRKDGANFGPFSCTVDGNAVSFQLQSTMTAVEGGGIAELTITKGSATVGTCNFGLMVEDAVFPNGVAYDSDPSVYQDILAYVQSIPASLTADYTSKINQEASERRTAINNEATLRAAADSQNSSAIETQKSRIDTYMSSGTSATNAELVDIRVAVDGTTYTNAGTAVRTQIDNIHEALKNYNNHNSSINLLDRARSTVVGRYRSYLHGGSVVNENYTLKDFIPVEPGKKFWISFVATDVHIAYMDEIGKFISGSLHNLSSIRNWIINVPSTAYFMSVSYNHVTASQHESDVYVVPFEYFQNEHFGGPSEEDLKNISGLTLKSYRNLIGNNIGLKDRYYNYSSGNIGNSNGYRALAIPAMPGETYACDSQMQFSFFDDDFSYISGIANPTDSYITCPSNAYIIGIGYRYKQADNNLDYYCHFNAQQSSGGVYSEFGSGDVYAIAGASTLTVGTGGMYSTISEAINAAGDDDEILILPGTYNETLNAYSKRLHIKGVSKEHCIIRYSADDYYAPPLHMAKGSVENLTIYAYWNGDSSILRAYCVHIDNINERGETLLFNNVNFISERGACVGIGLRTNCYLKFTNCLFRTTSTGTEGPIYNHTSESETVGDGGYAVYENQNVEYINNTIINETTYPTIKMQSQEHLSGCCKVTFLGNKIVQPNNNDNTVIMVRYQGRTLTNDHWMGSSDYILTNISELNSEDALNYSVSG